MQPVSNSLNVPFKLQKNPSPPTLTELGCKPIKDYTYAQDVEVKINQIADPVEKAKRLDDLVKVKSIIQDLIDSHKPFYFIDTTTSLVALEKPNKQVVWRAVDLTSGYAIDWVSHRVKMKANKLTLHINTGTHGNKDGKTAVEDHKSGDGRFIANDSALFRTDDYISLSGVNEQHLPLYPETANHVIDYWCWSMESLYSSQYHAEYKLDENRELTPPELRCVVSNTLMVRPNYFETCRKLNGRVHYYDRSSVDTLKRNFRFQLLTDKPIKCRLVECGADIFLSHALESKSMASTVEEFRGDRIDHKLKDREIVHLKDETQRKTERITVLETDKADLTRRVTVLNTEKVDLVNQRDQALEEKSLQEEKTEKALEVVKDQAEVIKHLKQEPHYQESVHLRKENARLQDQKLLERKHQVEGIGGWKTRLYMQKEYSKFRLDTIFNGMKTFGFYWERPNSFVSRLSTREDRDKNERIFERFLAERREDIQLLAKKKLAAYEGIYEHVKVSFTSDEYAKLLLPLMNKAFDDGSLSKRAVDQTVEYEVAIQEKPVVEWGSRESDRYMPKTYEETVKEILGEALRYELCEQMLKTLAS